LQNPGATDTQTSFVQGLWSSQLRGSCRQVPVVVSHASTVQKLKSLQSGQASSGAGSGGAAVEAFGETRRTMRVARMKVAETVLQHLRWVLI